MKGKLTKSAILIMILILVSNTIDTHASSVPVFNLKNNPQQVRLGDIFKVDIYLDNAVDLFALSLVIKYDSNILKPVGDGMTTTLPDYYILKSQIIDGTITYLASKVGSEMGVSGDIKVGTLEFKAERTGNALIEITEGQIVNSRVQKVKTNIGTNVNIIVTKPDGSTSPGSGEGPIPPGNGVDLRTKYLMGIISRREVVNHIQTLLNAAGTIFLEGTSQGTYWIDENDVDNAVERVNKILKSYDNYPQEIKDNLTPIITIQNNKVPGFTAIMSDQIHTFLKEKGFTLALSNQSGMFILSEIPKTIGQLEISFKEFTGEQLEYYKNNILEQKNNFKEPLKVYESFLRIDGSIIETNGKYVFKEEKANINEVSGYIFNHQKGSWSPLYSITMGSEKTAYGQTGIVAFMEQDKSFADLSNHWARSEIETLASRNIIMGTGGNNFSPSRNITRGEFAALLTRALNLPKTKETIGFTDVDKNHWFYDAVISAYQWGIVRGKSDGTFAPNAFITREEMALMMARAMEHQGMVKDLKIYGDPKEFSDWNTVSIWAQDGVLTSYKMGIIRGRTANTFAPREMATRAEAAVMLYRMIFFQD